MISDTRVVAHAAYAVVTISTILIFARFVLRRLRKERIYPDDWLMVFSLNFLGGLTSIWPLLIRSGSGIEGDAPIQRVHEKEFVSKMVMWSRICYLTYIWILQACMLLYYHRLTKRQPEQRYVKIVSWGIGFTWIITMVMWSTQCRPYNLNWKATEPPQKCARGQVGLLFMESVVVHCHEFNLGHYPLANDLANADGHSYKVEGIRGLYRWPISRWVIYCANHQAEALGMSLFANAPIVNALYRHFRRGSGSRHLSSRTQTRSGGIENVELGSADESREMDFMEALRVPGSESDKQPDGGFIQPLPPAIIASSSPHFSEPIHNANTNVFFSVSRSKEIKRDSSLRCVKTVEVVQTSEPADPKDPLRINPLGGIGRVETKISHHDKSPLPSNPDLYDDLYSSANRSLAMEDILNHSDLNNRN
ncbi:hypothetical protein NHQ30_000385 [Ciborinia camelliae]|nr:hypothetical protein NHQ30_000385 [Ciborinia camelliae]